MKTTAKIVQIGNSRGVRLPKRVIDEARLGGEVVVEVRNGEVVLRPVGPTRDWEESARLLHQRGEDRLLLGEQGPSDWDRHEWRW